MCMPFIRAYKKNRLILGSIHYGVQVNCCYVYRVLIAVGLGMDQRCSRRSVRRCSQWCGVCVTTAWLTSPMPCGRWWGPRTALPHTRTPCTLVVVAAATTVDPSWWDCNRRLRRSCRTPTPPRRPVGQQHSHTAWPLCSARSFVKHCMLRRAPCCLSKRLRVIESSHCWKYIARTERPRQLAAEWWDADATSFATQHTVLAPSSSPWSFKNDFK